MIKLMTFMATNTSTFEGKRAAILIKKGVKKTYFYTFLRVFSMSKKRLFYM